MPCKIAALPQRALLRVDGPDWRPFLHNLLTHDIEGLPPGGLRFTALLTPQGRLLHDLFVNAEESGAVLDVAAAGRDALMKRLTLYKLRAKVALEPLDGTVHAAWNTREPSPPDAGRGQGEGRPPRSSNSDATPDSDSPLSASAGSGSEHIWSLDPRLPDLGWRSIAYDGPTTATSDHYDAHRMALGVPDPALDGRDTDYPLELDFDVLNGIDFKKGCFIGQETTSRMKRRGAMKTRAVPLAFDGAPPPPGTEVLAGDLRAGEIRSGRKARAIALLRLDRALEAELTADGRPVRLNAPPWLAGALGLTS